MTKRAGWIWWLLAAGLLIAVGTEVFDLARETGFFIGRISSKWAAALGGYIVLALAGLYALGLQLGQSARSERFWVRVTELRQRTGWLRWLFALVLALLPGYFVFYADLGLLFSGTFTQILFYLICWGLLAFLLSEAQPIEWPRLLAAGLLVAVGLVLAEAFVWVSDYPFAQFWSEGNRIWDYSLRFGAERYNYPAGEAIFAWIDSGRQTLWGLPFLVPSISIYWVRLWSALVTTLPYALLGLVAFWAPKQERLPWLLTGAWALVFLDLGPVYTPLVLAAILVAATRRAPLWLALPAVYLAGHYAGLSRFSWSFAAGIWAALLALGWPAQHRERLKTQGWLRAVVLGLAGIWSKGLPIVLGLIQSVLPAVAGADVIPTATPSFPGTGSVTTPGGLEAAISRQEYIWSRLLPNEAFLPGILLALLLAVGPLLLLLTYLARRGDWRTTSWQRLVTVLGLAAFLLVGLVASAKVGGGLDLHNLDMFLVALVLVAGLAWAAELYPRLLELLDTSAYVRLLLVAMVFVPALRPIWLGQRPERPSAERTEYVLNSIREYTTCAAEYGEVLFMDERQLLTFGEVPQVPLVVDYEKKFVMDHALTENAAYFEQFEADLAAGRFSLILTESQPVDVRSYTETMSGDGVIEENNAWLFWVTRPLQADYQTVEDFDDVGVQLLMPYDRSYACP
jgi:hypothetical protein